MTMQRQAGFSLIEVLISIVILSVGLLGTAGLVTASLKGGNTSYYRSQATVLADDIIDRMRANVTAAQGGKYNIDLGSNLSVACGSSTAGTMPRFDCQDWKTALAQSLPNGEGSTSVDNNGVARVTVEWNSGADSFTTKSLL
jgi:type IV pilus assembly protein PilV